MNIFKPSLPILLLVTGAALATVPEAPVPEPLVLKPSMDQRYASNLATKFLTNWHYKDTRLDDELSSQIFDGYLELLDPNRSFFLASDIALFERYRDRLDESLRHNELAPAYEIFNIYVDRVSQRVQYARNRLAEPFDFTVDETYAFDRRDADWVATTEELDDLWRKRVKNDYLRLKLTEKDHDAIVETLEERYTGLERRVREQKTDDVFQLFMNAFAQAIEPHTAYLSPRTAENFEISMKLSLEGIGALLGNDNEYTSIARVVPGGPADRDGRLRAGDRIMGVGQGRSGKLVDVIGWPTDDVVDLIRGPKDTVVRLEVLSEEKAPGDPSEIIDITRGEVKLEEQAAKSEIIEVPGENPGDAPMKIGVIDLPVFYMDFNGRAQNKPDYRSSTRDVRRLIEELEAEGVQGLVIDLRNNGGGSLLEATTLTGLFIDKGPVVQVRNASGRISVEADSEPGMAWDGPLAVLVNRYSASASEIFAAAIQDYGRGLIIGETTFGKGTVQSLLDLDDYAPPESAGMGQLKITMAQFFRVNGGSTQNRGVVPDIAFPSAGDPDDYGERSLDNALPWTKIDAARFEPAGDLKQLAAVADFRYQSRVEGDEEFTWLLSDIDDFNSHKDDTEISLLEATRRAEIEQRDAKRKARKENGKGPLVDADDVLAEAEAAAVDEGDDALAADEEEEDEGPDLLLRESARIVRDIVELNGDHQLLAKQFSQLTAKAEHSGQIN